MKGLVLFGDASFYRQKNRSTARQKSGGLLSEVVCKRNGPAFRLPLAEGGAQTFKLNKPGIRENFRGQSYGEANKNLLDDLRDLQTNLPASRP